MDSAARGRGPDSRHGQGALFVWGLGVGMGLAFWVIDALGDAFLLRTAGFAEAMFWPGPFEALMRVLVIGLLLSMAAVARWIVAELRRGEAERVRAVAQDKELQRLREIDRFKTDFINTAAHELNTPLTPIKVQLHLLKAKESHAASPDRSVQILDRNFGRLSKLIQLVLDSARLQSGKLVVHKRPSELGAMVQESLESYRASAREADVTLTSRCERGLVVEVDPQWLSQVVENYLSNALKYTPPGGTITVEALRRGPDALVRVRDTGAGLRPDQMARLFQPFSRVHDDGTPGNGLGLYISKGIVEQQGGRFGVSSDGPGRGSTFWFSLPLQSLRQEWRPALPESAPTPSAPRAP